jgi:hypothetical protein
MPSVSSGAEELPETETATRHGFAGLLPAFGDLSRAGEQAADIDRVRAVLLRSRGVFWLGVVLVTTLLMSLYGYLKPKPALTMPTVTHRYDAAGCGDVRKRPNDLARPVARTMVLCLINFERQRRGLAPLVESTSLDSAAQAHSDDMVSRHYFEHDTPDGITPQIRIAQVGYHPTVQGTTGENIFSSADVLSSPAAAVDAWMRSPGHRGNILWPSFRNIGIGLTVGAAPLTVRLKRPGGTYTTDFGG